MIDLSCAFATSLQTPEHVRVAEELGYRRAWFYDSPALYPDVWAMLALAAERTGRIGLGPAVLVPNLRHPMTNAAAIAMLAALAPGRVQVAIGSGFTGRMTFGQRPLAWQSVRQYVAAVRALLRGEKVEWEGRKIAMMHPEGYGAARPVDVPFLIGAGGPKGLQAAKDLGAGVFVTAPPPRDAVAEGADCVILSFGTVLGAGEDVDNARVVDAAGHGAVVGLHAMYERGMDMSRFPGGAEWAAQLDAIPADERHIAIHDLHLVGVTERDRPMLTPEFLGRAGGIRTAEGWRAYLEQIESAGVTQIAYQPAGRDIPGELERFARAVGL